MTTGRRTIDRRRRVLYSTFQADQSNPTAASRREIQRLREARRPTAAYGARVKRRLRGRWFSLVPIRRRTFVTVASVLMFAAMSLVLMHFLSVAWPALSYQVEIARPFRLDRPDSFGRWFMIAMLATSTGVALLIYQIRRYRLDDYRGQYRLWRMVLIALAFASVHCLVGILDWAGAILDLMFGQRVALSGGDWIRVVAGLGGAVLGLRLVAEVRRSRWSLVSMMGVCAILAIPEAARWNVLAVDSVTSWMAVTTAPLVASTLLLISLGGYLRMLYREVREIDDTVSIGKMVGQWKVQWFTASDEENPEPEAAPRPKRTAKPVASEDEDSNPDEASSEKPGRRWFGLRAAKSPKLDSPIANETESSEEPESEPESQPEPADEVPEENQDGEATPVKSKRRWFGRKKVAAEDPPSDDEPASNQTPAVDQKSDDASEDNEEMIDPDSLDWNSMSKAEKRRMKKLLRRQDRAA